MKPQFLENVKPTKAQELLIENNGISWAKIHATLPEKGPSRTKLLKLYLISELEGFRREHILKRVLGALLSCGDYCTEERKEMKEQLARAISGKA